MVDDDDSCMNNDSWFTHVSWLKNHHHHSLLYIIHSWYMIPESWAMMIHLWTMNEVWVIIMLIHEWIMTDYDDCYWINYECIKNDEWIVNDYDNDSWKNDEWIMYHNSWLTHHSWCTYD